MAAKPFSSELQYWIDHDKRKTLGELNAIFGQKTFAMIFLIMFAIPATPFPTGGITHAILLPVSFIAAVQMVIGRRELWLPKRFKKVSVEGIITKKVLPYIINKLRWVEKYSRPRLSSWFNVNITRTLIGLIMIAFTVAAFIAPIFSGLDTLQSLGGVVIALSMLLEDIVLAVIGLILGVVGIGLIVFVGTAITSLVQHFF